MEPVIDLAPGAERIALARDLAEQIRQNVADSVSKRADFNSLRGAIAVFDDDAGAALTLRFDYGRLIVHGSLVGVPDVTLRGSGAAIRALGDLPSFSLSGLTLGLLLEPGARGGLATAMKSLGNGSLKGYGVGLHPRLSLRLLRILSKRK